MEDVRPPTGKPYRDWRAVFEDAQPMAWSAFNNGFINGAVKNNTQPDTFPPHRDPRERYDYAVMVFRVRRPTKGGVFGDGTFWAISTPGHTPDHLAFLVNTQPHRVLIAGDAELTTWAMQDEILVSTTGGARGREQVRRSASMIRAFHVEHPEAEIWFSHDEEHL